jgi:manganese oxidase
MDTDVSGEIVSSAPGRPRWAVPAGVGVVVALLAAVLLLRPWSLAGPAGVAAYTPQHRVYYLAADEVRWNYAPLGKNAITGQPFDETAAVFTKRGPTRIGSTYVKALYRGYTDATFTHLAPIAPQWQHLGMLGPVVRAVVGDHVTIVFKNNLDRPASVHVHGFKYNQRSEGAPYDKGVAPGAKGGDAVAPGKTYTYSYTVPERAGPGPMDGSSVMWMYHSHVDEVADDYAGLTGPMIVTRAEMARADGTPIDVDREFALQFQVSDENASPYLNRNIKTFAGAPAGVDPDDGDFQESNLMHSINGYVYGNQPLSSMTMTEGERVRFYMMGMGTEVDLHTPHFHGGTVVAMGMRTDVVNLLPASMVVADMVPDNPGTWLFHCHVNDHITAGMVTRYQVLPRP